MNISKSFSFERCYHPPFLEFSSWIKPRSHNNHKGYGLQCTCTGDIVSILYVGHNRNGYNNPPSSCYHVKDHVSCLVTIATKDVDYQTHTGLMIMTTQQTFCGQINHMSGQIRFVQTNILYIINGNLWSLIMNIWTICNPYHKHCHMSILAQHFSLLLGNQFLPLLTINAFLVAMTTLTNIVTYSN